MNKVRSCTTEENFKKMLNGTIVANKVAESTSISANSWAWNESYKATHINDSSTSIKSTTEINLGYLKVGDKVILSSEFMNINGVKGKILLDCFDNSIYSVGATTELNVNSKNNDFFEILEVEFTVKKDGYYKALFGLLTADIGEFYVRNCFVDIISKADLQSSNYKQVIKTGNIKTSGVGVFERDTRFGVDDFTITTNTNYLILTLNNPFTYSLARPIVIIGEDSSSSQYRIRTTSQQLGTITIQLYNTTTNTLVDHNTIPAGVYFSVTMIGYDFV